MAVTNAPAVAADIAGMGLRVERAVVSTTVVYTGLLRTEIIKHASTGRHKPGRPHIPGTGPGPNVATADYIRSWATRVDISPLRVQGEAFTNAPQGRRLEYGFVGIDALGRTVHAPPYPHAIPALNIIRPQYLAALSTAIDKEVK